MPPSFCLDIPPLGTYKYTLFSPPYNYTLKSPEIKLVPSTEEELKNLPAREPDGATLESSLYTSEMMQSFYGRFMAPARYQKTSPSRIIDDVEYNDTSTSYNATSTSSNATSTSYNATSISKNTTRTNATSIAKMPVLALGKPVKRKTFSGSVHGSCKLKKGTAFSVSD